MKKGVSFLLTTLLICSLTSCGGGDSGGSISAENGSEGSDKSKILDTSSSPETYDAEYTLFVNGSDEWTPFPGKSGVNFECSNEYALSVRATGSKVEFTGKQVADNIVLTATLDGQERRALVEVKQMLEAAIPVEFISIDQMPGQDGGTVQIEIKLEPGNIGLMTSDVTITPDGAAGFYLVQYVNWEDFSHTIPIETPSQEVIITITLEKEGYTFSPASREVTIVPPEK